MHTGMATASTTIAVVAVPTETQVEATTSTSLAPSAPPSSAPSPRPSYFLRLRGGRSKLPWPPWRRVLWSTVGSFVGILTLTLLHRFWCLVDTEDLMMIIGSFGAQAVLVFGAPGAPLAQPWNCIVGNTLSAFIGVTLEQISSATIASLRGGARVPPGGATLNTTATAAAAAALAASVPSSPVLLSDEMLVQCIASSLAVSLSVAAMQCTLSLHPPGGATALIATMGSARVKRLG